MRAEEEDSDLPHCAKTGPATLYRCVTALRFEMYLISAERQNTHTQSHTGGSGGNVPCSH